MLLYRMTKLVEDHSRLKQEFSDPFGELMEMARARERMELSLRGMAEEDCSDWGRHATY
ncbi:hypothetical protein [Paenibacillus sp. YN15]|uniref:hypothetical protein n=1 Tax=Paenibacillus sp. YN15 TaxID=1742774 RepID=UPI0015EB343B|nr:hypothetical protein [Paenibacillus sp. YN15]